ncbi:MAG: flagellar basal body-associated protein FliL [Sulfuricella sp.]|nr:flagellar basal body-associated protein FliL [Sulfuricella sp.]
MAQDKAKKEEAEEDAAPIKKKGGVFLILAILLVLGGLGGGAAWYFSQSGAKPEEKAKPPIFVTLETFTVNLQGDGGSGGGERYLQVGIDLKVADPAVVDLVKLHMPEIRNGILLLLSSKSAEQVTGLEGKQKLIAEIQGQVAKPLAAAGKGVIGVYFTSFVIQ